MSNVLVINAGSSSLKYAEYLFENGVLTFILKGQFDFNRAGAATEWEHNKEACSIAGITRNNAVEHIFHLIGKPDAVVHRIVMGGDTYTTPFKIDGKALCMLESLIPLAPLHQPHNLELVKTIRRLYPDILQIGSPDTGFHSTIPAKRRRLPVAERWYDAGAKRWGFHGHSVASIADQLKVLAPNARRAVIAHLGSGASTTALRDGVSVDTSMSLSPLCGNLMGTRPGDLDPGVVLFMIQKIMREHPETTARALYTQLEHTLYKESGLLGISGMSADMRDLLPSTDLRTQAAVETFCESAAKQIAMMAVSMGGMDTLVFTAGIGENSPPIREQIIARLAFLGAFTVLVIQTNEELVMAQAALPFLGAKAAVAAE